MSPHKAILALDELLPHRSRICDLSIVLYSSDPDWVDEDDRGQHGELTLLHHHFFRKALPNLQHLKFRAAHTESSRYMIPTPGSLFAAGLPRLKELKYVGASGGLLETAKNLDSCEIGSWSEAAGPAIFYPEDLRTFLDNNNTLKSLTINECELMVTGPWVPTATPMTDLKFLRIECRFI